MEVEPAITLPSDLFGFDDRAISGFGSLLDEPILPGSPDSLTAAANPLNDAALVGLEFNALDLPPPLADAGQGLDPLVFPLLDDDGLLRYASNSPPDPLSDVLSPLTPQSEHDADGPIPLDTGEMDTSPLGTPPPPARESGSGSGSGSGGHDKATKATKKAPTRKRGRGRAKAQPLDPAAVQEQMLKKQRRMMKNRESASASRRKKKEYLESLEERTKEQSRSIAGLNQQVDALTRENTALRRELEQLRGGSTSRRLPAVGTTVMICLLCFAFNPFATRLPSTTVVPMRQPFTPFRAEARVPSSSLLLEDRSSHARPKTGSTVAVRRDPHPDKSELQGWIEETSSKLGRNGTDALGFPRGRAVAPTIAAATKFRLDDSTKHLLAKAQRTDSTLIFCSEVQVLAAKRKPPAGQNPKMSLVMPTPHQLRKNATDAIYTNTLMKVDFEVTGTKSIRLNDPTI